MTRRAEEARWNLQEGSPSSAHKSMAKKEEAIGVGGQGQAMLQEELAKMLELIPGITSGAKPILFFAAPVALALLAWINGTSFAEFLRQNIHGRSTTR